MFERNPVKELPDGMICKVYPFHISLEGMEKKILCRERNDYDVFVKIMHVCSLRKNVLMVIYAVVSNHAHAVVLAADQSDADAYGEEIKRMYSMYFSRKYSDRSVLKGMDAKAIWIDTDWYVRNSIAYDIRNALDNGAQSIQLYPWSGYRGMFCGGQCTNGSQRLVRSLSKREKERIMHTDDDLSKVPWILDSSGELEPASTCDWRYVESAFANDQAFFLKIIGCVNTAEMEMKLVDNPRTMMKDEEFLKTASDICLRWFKSDIHSLSLEKKARIIPYVWRTMKTTVAQLARTFEISKENVEHILRKR